MQRGEVWISVWPNDPTKKPRPVLIVSNHLRNSKPHISDVIVVKLTSLERSDGSKKPINEAEDLVIHLKKKTIIRCGAVYTIEKTCLSKRISTLSSLEMAAISQRLKNVFELI